VIYAGQTPFLAACQLCVSSIEEIDDVVEVQTTVDGWVMDRLVHLDTLPVAAISQVH